MRGNIEFYVRDHESCGALRADKCLGFRSMPPGYALMLDPDCNEFYWLRCDGVESCQGWDKWSAYRGAVEDSKKPA